LNKSISANDIFLGIQDEKKLAANPTMRLTDEQQAAVEAPLDSPVLVIAGAGSGKTELMSIRVLWLIANSLALPQDILGLTFTRKAASELAKRINNGIARLEQTAYWPTKLTEDGYALPTISTYNSYANSLFRDNALALGYEPEANLLTDSSAYQLAKRVVLNIASDLGLQLDDVDLTLKTAIDGVLKLAAELNDNLATGADVRREIAALRRRIEAVPTKKGQLAATHADFFAGAFKKVIVAKSSFRGSSITATKLHWPSERCAKLIAFEPPSVNFTKWCCSTNIKTPRSCKPRFSDRFTPIILCLQWVTRISPSTDGAAQAPQT
jgi:UvrD/REP helicase N-terminal domain